MGNLDPNGGGNSTWRTYLGAALALLGVLLLIGSITLGVGNKLEWWQLILLIIATCGCLFGGLALVKSDG